MESAPSLLIIVQSAIIVMAVGMIVVAIRINPSKFRASRRGMIVDRFPPSVYLIVMIGLTLLIANLVTGIASVFDRHWTVQTVHGSQLP